MKWLAILNPAAHNGVALNQLRILARQLRQGLGIDCAWTSCPQDARAIIRSSQGFHGYIAVGGDGTISEVINGLDLKSQCLGIIPAGTGNGLARDLRMLDTPSALDRLRRPQLAALDLIQVRYRIGQDWHERYIIHTSALGYTAEVVALGIGPLKRLGHLRYAVAACLQCGRQQPFHVRIQIDDRPWQELLLTNLVVNNTRYAGHFCLFPDARLQDGRLNVLYGQVPPTRQLLEDLGILTQTYYLERSIRCQGRAVAVDLAAPTTLMLDGELVPAVDAVRFQVVDGALRCAVGKVPGIKVMEGRQGLSGPSAPPARSQGFFPC